MSRNGLPIFATRLRAAREAAGLSQRGLGIALGIDADAASPRLNQYERGRREPDFATASRLAALLEVPLAYLYCEDDQLAEALLMLARLDEERRRKAFAAIAQLASEASRS